MPQVVIGTAGWGIPRDHASRFPAEGSGLARYGARLVATEINSTFWRRHRPATFERWRDSVPNSFRFAVKLPRAITHEAGLVAPRAALRDFFDDVRGLGAQLGPILVQLPASAEFDPRRVRAFFRSLRALHSGPVACEPRHPGWYTADATKALVDYDVARVVADPPRPAAARSAAGTTSLRYYRLHGSPHVYRSAYGDERLRSLVSELTQESANATVWCIFDNTASGAALGDALRSIELLESS